MFDVDVLRYSDPLGKLRWRGWRLTVERYALSFTTGGLLSTEGQRVAQAYLTHGDWAEVARNMREHNDLQARTGSSNARVLRETLQRVSTLSDAEILLISDGSPTESRHLMWVAACRRYGLVAEFAEEVVRERFLVMNPVVSHDDFDQFLLGKSLWHPELDEIRSSTVKKLRQNIFRMLREVGFRGESGSIVPAMISSRIVDALNRRVPSDIRFFPTTLPVGPEQ